MDCIPLEMVSGNHTGEHWNQQWSNNRTFDSALAYRTSNSESLGNDSMVLATTNGYLDHESDKNALLTLEKIIYSRLIVLICIFGAVGNILNLLVLTRKGLQKQMDRMEKSAHYGLVALALSDLLFCLAVIPNAWVDKHQFYFQHWSFSMFYKMHGDSLINVFIMSSTWLTVAMATSRYLAICHPLHARDIIGMTFARVSIIVVFVLCVLFNLPRFWNEVVDHMDCVGDWRVYFPMPGPMKLAKNAETIYMWLYFLFGILVPLIALAYCNANLIKALRHSTKMRRQYQRDQKVQKETTNQITLTLIIIVILYFLLVVPAEAINFTKRVIIDKESALGSFNVANAVVNTLQAINFSFNFILYCVINVHFRRTLKELFCCFCIKKGSRTGNGYESVTLSQTGYTRNTAVSEF